MRNVNLVADELHNAGFRTKVLTSNFVDVSLTSRKPSALEVKTALNQIFEKIEFGVTSTADSVIVEV